MNLQEAFAQLGLPVDADERTVRRAYACMLKDIDQLTQPQAFIALRSAYEQVMAYARTNSVFDPPDAEPDKAEPQQMRLEPQQSLDLQEPVQPDGDAKQHERISADTSPAAYAEPEQPVMNPMAVAEQLLDAWQWQFAPQDIEAALEELQSLLASPELENLENRGAFEMELARRIMGKTLGVRRSALLVAADSRFAWRQQGVKAEVLEYILDGFDVLKPRQRQVAIALLGEPNPQVVQALRLTPESLDLFEQQWHHWLAWWLPEGQLQRWRQEWTRLPAGVRVAEGLRRSANLWKARTKAFVLRMALAGVLLAAGLMFFNWFADRSDGSQQRKSDIQCAQTLALGRATAWRSVPADKLLAFSSCITNLRVATKADMRGLEQAKRITRALTGVNQQLGQDWFVSSQPNLYLNMPDGRAFGFVRPESPVRYCAELRSFALRNQWLQVGDVPSAKAFVQELAWCTTQKTLRDDGGAKGLTPLDKSAIYKLELDYSTTIWSLLRHVDAWPDAKRPLLSLHLLVNETKLPDFDWRLPTELGTSAAQCAHESSLVPCQQPDSRLSLSLGRVEGKNAARAPGLEGLSSSP